MKSLGFRSDSHNTSTFNPMGNLSLQGHCPRVNIGLPVFNGERFMEEALESILAQTFEDFELIISDNASTDRTHEICERYCKKDPRIRFYRNERNLGAGWNFQHVFELSHS